LVINLRTSPLFAKQRGAGGEFGHKRDGKVINIEVPTFVGEGLWLKEMKSINRKVLRGSKPKIAKENYIHLMT
jgi:hypothetical protein